MLNRANVMNSKQIFEIFTFKKSWVIKRKNIQSKNWKIKFQKEQWEYQTSVEDQKWVFLFTLTFQDIPFPNEDLQ